MKAFALNGWMSIVVAGLLIGCGGGGTDDDDHPETTNPGTTDPGTTNPGTVSTVDLGGTTYLVPKGTTAKEVDINGSKEMMISSGNKQEVGGFVHQVRGTATPKSSDALTNAKRVEKGVQTVYSALSADTTTISSISLLSSQSYQTPYSFTLASYSIQTINSEYPLDLAAKIVNIMNGGAGNSGISIADPSAPQDTDFRLLLLYGEYQGSMFYIAGVVPSSQYAQYATVLTTIINAARVSPTGTTLQNTSQSFTVSTGSGNADFLFVVDDSGSMGDDQDALSKAADQFTAEMQGSGVAYRTAIITTGDGATEQNLSNASEYGAYKVLKAYGIIENNASRFKEQLVQGINGSWTETGIWNAEQALQIAGERNATGNGVLTQLGMPESNASLSVVIISDEPSQYPSRSTGGVEFNVSDNLFVDRDITVFAIVDPGYNYSTSGIFDEYNQSQYDDLATITGGAISDIRNTKTEANGSVVLDYSYIMHKIAVEAGGASSSFVLTHPAASISAVSVNGTVIQHDTTNGYTYVQSSQSIVFHGTAVPPNGASIVVTYEYYQ